MSASEVVLAAGRYALGELIGRGGMSDVYRGTDIVLARPVAVKLLRDPGVDVNDEARARSEARMLASLSHPSLVTVYDAGIEGGRPFIVMELIDGPTLAAVCAAGPGAPGRVAQVGAQIADALGYVHAQGLVHRDVKPGNVLLRHLDTPEPQALLSDFGVARLVDSTRLTATGFTVGTAGYLAPEQVRGEDVTSAADIYALGLVLLECLTGRREYPGSNVEAAVARLHRQPQLPGNLSADWRELLLVMTADDPTQRPTAGQVAARLHATDGATTVALGPISETVPLAPTRALSLPSPSASAAMSGAASRRLRGTGAKAAAAALAVLVLALGALAITDQRGSNDTVVQPLPAPDVPGKVGQDLQRLHEAVNP